MNSIGWSPEAALDLQELYDYITRDSAYYASKQVDSIISRAESLLLQPLSGRRVPEVSTDTVREIFDGNYRIIYRLDKLPEIQIMRVIHFARRY